MAVLFLAAACLSLVALRALYNLYLHPLSRFPGPWYTCVAPVWLIYHQIRGDHPWATTKLHDRYGSIVRVAPDELSYTDPAAFNDIYGHRNGVPENPKHPSQNFTKDTQHPTILDANQAQHSLLRRLLSNAFSDKVMKEQEPVLIMYVDLLIKRLATITAESSEIVDLVEWYNFTTFDVIGHLTFAEPFDCLQDAKFHQWAAFVFSAIRHDSLLRSCKRVCGELGWKLGKLTIPRRLQEGRQAHWQATTEKVLRRKANEPNYTDFMTHLLRAEREGKIEMADLFMNAPIIVGAGSQTTATLLSGATFLLLTHPRAMQTAVKEIRDSFQRDEEINLVGINKCHYLLAVLDEALRMYPPAVHNHPRIIPSGGATILGEHITSGTAVGIHKYAIAHTKHNFVSPDEFIPERFTERERFPYDRREALNPFSYGPRACIGRNLAYVEMRLVMCKMLWHFDMELDPASKSWLNQRAFAVWEKKPLYVSLKPVIRNE